MGGVLLVLGVTLDQGYPTKLNQYTHNDSVSFTVLIDHVQTKVQSFIVSIQKYTSNIYSLAILFVMFKQCLWYLNYNACIDNKCYKDYHPTCVVQLLIHYPHLYIAFFAKFNPTIKWFQYSYSKLLHIKPILVTSNV